MVSKPARLPSGVRLSGITAGCLPLTPEFFNEGQANCKAVRYIALRLFLCFECLNDLFTKVLGVGFHSPLPCLMFTVHATATRSSFFSVDPILKFLLPTFIPAYCVAIL